MRVCYFGTYRAGYTRNKILIQGLRRAGVEVVECHVKLWSGIQDRVNVASGGWFRPKFILRVISVYLNLLRKYRDVGKYDVMIVGYPGQLDVYLARFLTWLRRKPLVLDILMSIYLVCKERGLDKLSPLTIWGLRQAEWLACRLPDLLIIEGPEYRDWFINEHKLDESRFGYVPLGADDDVFRPVEISPSESEYSTVLYHGSFLPSHGVNTIIEAAKLLREEKDVVFHLLGKGPEKDHAVASVRKYGLENVEFLGFVSEDELLLHLSQADICLGVFGSTPQAQMTMQNKIFETLAMGKAIISSDSSAIRAALIHGEHIYLIPREDPQALADAIRTLKDDVALRERMGRNAFQIYYERFSIQNIGDIFSEHLKGLR
jgi:glycosyltransferase involved in cell wall biosynthesis